MLLTRTHVSVAALVPLLLACELRPLTEHLDGGPESGAPPVDGPPLTDGPPPTEGPPPADGPPPSDGLAGACPGKPLHQSPDPTKMTGWFTSIAVGPGGEVHIGHQAASVSKPRYARRSSGVWTNETVQATGQAGLNTSLALGAGGLVHMVYFDLDVGRFKYVQRQPTTGWGIPETLAGTRLGGVDLEVDATGVVHLVTYGKLSSEIVYLRRETSSWKPAVVLESSGDSAGPRPGLVVKSGAVHVSLCAKGGELKYLHKPSGGSFSATTLVSSGLGKYCNTDLAIDGLGDAHIVYLNSDARTLHYIGQTKGTFGSPRKIADVAGTVGLSNAIVATPTGDLWLAFFNGTTTSLDITRRRAGSWDPKPLSVAPAAGRYLSAALGPDAALHLAHWSTFTTQLVYTRVCP